MSRSEQPLYDAIIDSGSLSSVIETIASAKAETSDILSSQFLGEHDVLQDLRACESDFQAYELETCERRLLTLQAHLERVAPENAVGLSCIFLCLGLVKQRQQLFYQSFGYFLHALSLLERGTRTINILAVFILNALHALEVERNESERAEVAQLLSRLVTHKLRVSIPESLSIWEYLRNQQDCGTVAADGMAGTLEMCRRNFRQAVRDHGVGSFEAAAAAGKLGATLYAKGDLLEARVYLERGLAPRVDELHLREVADICDLLVTICEELRDSSASNKFRVRSRILRMYSSTMPGARQW